ncbi:hypothetical protein ACLOJK_024877 [Asimina triloba]
MVPGTEKAFRELLVDSRRAREAEALSIYSCPRSLAFRELELEVVDVFGARGDTQDEREILRRCSWRGLEGKRWVRAVKYVQLNASAVKYVQLNASAVRYVQLNASFVGYYGLNMERSIALGNRTRRFCLACPPCHTPASHQSVHQSNCRQRYQPKRICSPAPASAYLSLLLIFSGFNCDGDDMVTIDELCLALHRLKSNLNFKY